MMPLGKAVQSKAMATNFCFNHTMCINIIASIFGYHFWLYKMLFKGCNFEAAYCKS